MLCKSSFVCCLEVKLFALKPELISATFPPPAGVLITPQKRTIFRIRGEPEEGTRSLLHFPPIWPHAPYMGMELDRAQRLLGINAEIQEAKGDAAQFEPVLRYGELTHRVSALAQ